jgi:hypothetical protein
LACPAPGFAFASAGFTAAVFVLAAGAFALAAFTFGAAALAFATGGFVFGAVALGTSAGGVGFGAAMVPAANATKPPMTINDEAIRATSIPAQSPSGRLGLL